MMKWKKNKRRNSFSRNSIDMIFSLYCFLTYSFLWQCKNSLRCSWIIHGTKIIFFGASLNSSLCKFLENFVCFWCEFHNFKCNLLTTLLWREGIHVYNSVLAQQTFIISCSALNNSLLFAEILLLMRWLTIYVIVYCTLVGKVGIHVPNL